MQNPSTRGHTNRVRFFLESSETFDLGGTFGNSRRNRETLIESELFGLPISGQ